MGYQHSIIRHSCIGEHCFLHSLISDLYYCSTTLCSQMEHFAIGAYSQGGLLPERCAIVLLRSQTSKSNMEDEILRCIDAPALAFDSCA